MRILLCLSLLCLGSAAFAADWVDLLRQDKLTELERLGEKAGATELALMLASEERPRRLAALHAVAGASDSWALLGILSVTAADPDRSLAVLAAQVAAAQTQALDGFAIEEQEISDHDLTGWHNAWLALALQAERWVDIRVYSLEVATGLHERIARAKQTPIPWERFFADPDGEIRAAAIALAPDRLDFDDQAASFVASDPSELVALVAAQRLCGPLGNNDKVVRKDLSAEVWARLRTLAENKSLPISVRVDLANCFVTDASAESKHAIATLVQQSTPSLRKAMAVLMQTSAQ